jgi:hypothetical protein
VFAKRKKPPNAMAEVLRRLAEQGIEDLRGAVGACAGPLGEAAIDVITQAAQERYGLGFIPGMSRLNAGDERLLLSQAFPDFIFWRSEHPSRQHAKAKNTKSSTQRGRRKGNGMPFAADFSGAAQGRTSSRREGPNQAAFKPDPFDGVPGDEPSSTQQAPWRDPRVMQAYAKIGLAFGAPMDAVKQRRRDLAKQLHSDHHGHGDDRQLGEINAAVDVIEDWLSASGRA